MYDQIIHWVLTKGIIPSRQLVLKIGRWLAQDSERLPAGNGEFLRAIPVSAVDSSRKRGFRRRGFHAKEMGGENGLTGVVYVNKRPRKFLD
jgi:hypothetical protein